jgi:hypothetical protein
MELTRGSILIKSHYDSRRSMGCANMNATAIGERFQMTPAVIEGRRYFLQLPMNELYAISVQAAMDLKAEKEKLFDRIVQKIIIL